MKKKNLISVLALTLSALMLLVGCSNNADPSQPSVGGSQVETPSSSEPSDNGGVSANGESGRLAALLGKSDADVVTDLGEGTATADESGAVTVREYDLPLFGLDTITTVSFENGNASLIISYAAEYEFDSWATALTGELGAAQSDATGGEADGNNTREMLWNLDGIIYSLKDAFGALSLEIFPEA